MLQKGEYIMENCFKCNEGLDDSIKSAVKEDGSYYILCKNCGNVMYITKNAFGHLIVRNTADDNSEETKAQIVEAMSYLKTMVLRQHYIVHQKIVKKDPLEI
jgi:hypothetical protein